MFDRPWRSPGGRRSFDGTVLVQRRPPSVPPPYESALRFDRTVGMTGRKASFGFAREDRHAHGLRIAKGRVVAIDHRDHAGHMESTDGDLHGRAFGNGRGARSGGCGYARRVRSIGQCERPRTGAIGCAERCRRPLHLRRSGRARNRAPRRPTPRRVPPCGRDQGGEPARHS